VSFVGLSWQTWTMRLVAGLNQSADPRSIEPPDLDELLDAQFDKVGGVQTRYPFGEIEDELFDGSTILGSGMRRVFANGDERVLFANRWLYSQNAQDDKWHLRDEHLAIAVDQVPVFQTTDEQITCDRAELDGVIVTAWTVSKTGGNKTYVAARDKDTGAIVLSPTALPGNAVTPRLVALESKILLFFSDGLGNLLVYALDPADPGAALAGASTTVLATNFNANYDAVACPGLDKAVVAMRRTVTTSYQVAFVTSAPAVSSSTTKARACTGPISVAWESSAPIALVVRNNTTDIKGDLLTSGLADGTVNTTIGTTGFPLLNLTAAWQTSSQAAVFWDDLGATFSSVFRNTISSAAAVGTTASTHYATLASRAFMHDSEVYVWYATDSTSSATDTSGNALFTAALQNCYLLYRDDGMPFAKAAWMRAGGRPGAGYLPGVASTDTNRYAWCGTEMRLISTDAHSFPAYADRNPVDIMIEFDSNRARRAARSGGTMYIASGLGLLQYDGVGLAEVGFLQFPFAFTVADGGAGTMVAGGYSYKSTLRWQNAAGEVDRSTTATFKGITQIASKEVDITFDHFDHTLKRDPRSNIAIEFWRTAVNAPPGADFKLVTGVDPSATTGDNRYIENVPGTTAAAFTDSYPEATLAAAAGDPEPGDTLEGVAPPPCQLVEATDTRVFIAAIAGQPDLVMYSKQRGPNEVASFNDALSIPIPAAGGPITGLALLNKTLFVFRERAVYRIDGEGLDNTGGGFNYQAERIQGEVGALNQESIAVTENGVIFKSWKGWQITNGQSIRYIGDKVKDFDGHAVLAADVMKAQHQVRFLVSSAFDPVAIGGGGVFSSGIIPPPIVVNDTVSPACMLMFDTNVGQWAQWSVDDGVHSCVWNSRHVVLTDTGPRTQLTEYTDLDYGLDLETGWIKLNDLAGYGRVRWFQTLGEYRSAHKLRVRVAMDYDDTFIDDTAWTPSPTTVGGPEQLEHGPSEQKMSAIKIRLTAVNASGVGAPTGEALRLTGLSFRLGIKPEAPRLPALQKQ